MRHIVRGLVTFLLIAIFLFLMGPCFPVDEPTVAPSFALIEQLKDPEAYLHQAEKHDLPHLKTGLHKRILWGARAGERTKFAFVYYHGFSASHQDTAPLLQEVARTLGANVILQRLHGHGFVDSRRLGETKWTDWLADSEEGYQLAQKIGDQVIPIGMSTGALLAIRNVLQYQKTNRIPAVVLMSPNFMPKAIGAEYLSGPFGKLWARLLIGSERSFPAENLAHEFYWTTRYPSQAVVELMNLIRAAQDWPYNQVAVPALCIHASEDSVVRLDFVKSRCKEMRAQVVSVGKRHELTGRALGLDDNISEIVRLITDFASALAQ